MDNYKIAVATSDGIVVNQHFGHANLFYIYEVHDKNLIQTEIRHVNPACISKEHDENAVLKNLKLIEDCRFLLVSRIGTYAQQQAENLGITPFEIPHMVEDALKKAVSFVEIQNLFERN